VADAGAMVADTKRYGFDILKEVDISNKRE
jgi:hypothetical protein